MRSFKSIFLISILQLTTLVAFAQDANAPVVIEFDFEKKTYKDASVLGELSKGDFFQIKITNINQNLYSVSFDKKDTTYSKDLGFKPFSTFSLDALSSVVANIVPPSLTGILGEHIDTDMIEDKEMYIFQFDKDLDLEETVPNWNKLNKITQKNIQDEADLRKKIYQTQKEIKAIYNNISILKSKIYETSSKYEMHLLHYSVDNGNTLFGDLPQTFNLSTFNQEFASLQNTLLNIIDINSKLSNSYFGVALNYSKILESNDELKKAHSTITKYFEESTKVIAEIEKSIHTDSKIELLKSIVMASNNDQSYYLSMPLQFTEEQSQLKINITPKNKEYPLNSFSAKLTLPTKEKSTFWGISTGFYISGLKNEAYSIKSSINSNSDTVFTLIKEDPGNLEFGMNSLLKYGKILNDHGFNFHLGFGPGISINDKIRPRLMAGAGLGCGTKHKVLLDFGGIVGSVDTKSNAISQEGEYYMLPEKITVSKTKFSWYASITYLFSL